MGSDAGSLNRRDFLARVSLFAAAGPGLAKSTNTLSQSKTNKVTAPVGIQNLNELLEPLVRQSKVPALAAAAIVDGKLKGVGAFGIRKGFDPTPVKGTDLWHIGSCTKAMTATLIAIHVEKKKLQWDTTIADALPEISPAIHASYRDVTITQLLQHRGGLPSQPDARAWEAAWASRATAPEQRYEFIKAILAKDPESEPGTKYNYSNQGYAIAGVMLERTVNESWESLMRDQLFRPLQMTSSGFGVPGTIGDVDQPWGHKWKNGKLEPQQTDNPPAIHPAGGVHCSIYDLSKFVLLHLNGARGEARLLKPETFRILQTPPEGQDYAMGWMRLDRAWGKGSVLNHNGSNTLNFCSIWIAPEIKFAAISCSNIGGDTGQKTCDDTIGALIKKYVLAPPPAES